MCFLLLLRRAARGLDLVFPHHEAEVAQAEAAGKPFARYWLHWNMTNINFGFETIEHRYRVLTDKAPPKVDDSKKYNLSSLVSDVYGKDYVDHPKMLNLMEVNGGKPREFLTGAEEVEAFERKEYLKLHKSTMCKVYFFKSVFHKIIYRKLKTARSNWPNKLNRALESLPAKVLALIAVLYTVGQLGYNTYASIDSNKNRPNQENDKIEPKPKDQVHPDS